MAEINYLQTHPLYDMVAPTYQRNTDLYDGGESVDGKMAAKKFLTQHPYEKDKQYGIRIVRAAYRNLAAPTVDLFSSSITNGIERVGIDDIPSFASMLRNCDRGGSSPDVFFKNVVTRSAAVGAEFVLVDMPQAHGQATTQAEVAALGLSPYFVRIPAVDVICWDYDEEGALDWAVTKSVRKESSGPFTPFVDVVSVTLWTKTEWRRYTSHGGGSFDPDGEGSLFIGMVPLVPFLYEQDTPMTGRSVIDDVARLIIRVFNQDSELDKMLFDAALPLLAAFGLTEEDEEALTRATSSLWRFGDKDARLEYVEPSGTSFNAKRQQIQDDIESIREISLRQTKPKGAGIESAEAKRLDAVQISSQLADFARSAAASERKCWEIAGRYLSVDQPKLDAISINYNETFDPDSLREKLTSTYMELRGNGDISRETVWRQLGMTKEQIEEEKALLEEEGRAATGPSGNLASSITATLLRQGAT